MNTKQPLDYAEDEAKEWEELRQLADELYIPQKRWWERAEKPMGLYFIITLIVLAFFAGWALG